MSHVNVTGRLAAPIRSTKYVFFSPKNSKL